MLRWQSLQRLKTNLLFYSSPLLLAVFSRDLLLSAINNTTDLLPGRWESMRIRGKKARKANGRNNPSTRRAASLPCRQMAASASTPAGDQTEEETMTRRMTIGATLTAVALVLSLPPMA